MMTDIFPDTKSSDTHSVKTSPFGFANPMGVNHPKFSVQWSVHQNSNPVPLAFGQTELRVFLMRLQAMAKLQRQHGERLAAVFLDQPALNLLNALDRETSIRWEDLPNRAESDWSEASRGAALLAGANLCEVSPTRIRLSEYGDKLLADSSLTDEVTKEIAI